MEVLLILIHLHKVLIYSIIFLISYIELWDSSALIMDLYMLFFPMSEKRRTGRKKDSSIILWLFWRMIIYCLRRWGKHQEDTLIKTGQKAGELFHLFCKETKWRFRSWSCKLCHFLLECTNECSHLSSSDTVSFHLLVWQDIRLKARR